MVKAPESHHQRLGFLQRWSLLTGETQTDPPNKPMKRFENTVKVLTDVRRGIIKRSLVVGIPHPGECAHRTDDEGKVGDNPNNEDRIVVDRKVPEVVHDLEDKPAGTR